MTRAAIGIGSNLGDAPAAVRAGIQALARTGVVAAVSSLYRTKPWGRTGQADFCNAVALVDTLLDPRELLHALKRLESELGRVPGERWGPRSIDFDILLYGLERIDEPDLTVPHPRLLERAFALAPLAELDHRYAAALAELPAAERAAVVLQD